jgi:hypothetical protein
MTPRERIAVADKDCHQTHQPTTRPCAIWRREVLRVGGRGLVIRPVRYPTSQRREVSRGIGWHWTKVQYPSLPRPDRYHAVEFFRS